MKPRRIVPPVTGSSTRLSWDSVCARRQGLEPHFPQLDPQASWTVPVAVALMHDLKAGGMALKFVMWQLVDAAKLPMCGVPVQFGVPVLATQLTPAQQQACRMSFTEPGSTFEVAHLTKRPTLLVTSLRPPSDHWVSYYNYACACNVERDPSLRNCTATSSFEEHSMRVAWQVINLLLNGHQNILRACAKTATALGAAAERQLEDIVLRMLTDRLSLPCMTTVHTYEIDVYQTQAALRERWRPYGLTWPTFRHPLPANKFNQDRCPASQRHWLQNAKSEATLQRLAAATKQSLPMRVQSRLWQWFEANGRGLWTNSSAPCTIRMPPARRER